MCSVAPTAYVTDITNYADRPQALALLRTAGDIGMLSGSILAGVFADLVSSNVNAIQVNGSIMVGVAAFTAFRFFTVLKPAKAKAKSK